jgi:hypothetical protein
MSIEQAQKLVTCGYHDTKFGRKLEQMTDKTKGFFKNNNYFCLLVGKASYVSHLGIPFHIPLLLNRLTFGLLGNILLYIAILSSLMYFTPLSFLPYAPFTLLSYMTFGQFQSIETNSLGWLISCGLLGIRNYGESFRGSLFDLVVPAGGPAKPTKLHIGATGFTGLCFYNFFNFTADTTYILGQAVHVKMSY